MHNTLPHFVYFELFDTVKITVVIECLHLDARHFIDHAGNTSGSFRFVGRDIVVWRGDIGI